MADFVAGASWKYQQGMVLEFPDVPGQVFSAMNVPSEEVDPAAVFAIAISLRKACEMRENDDPTLNLGAAYNGRDQFTRELMRVAHLFEEWACVHVAFDHLEHAWSYLLEARFGEACLAVIEARELTTFDADDCLRVAFRLRLPVWEHDKLPLPVNELVRNTVAGSDFKFFRIQTVRDWLTETQVFTFMETDEPFDENWGERYFGIYGVHEDNSMEHISDRGSYAQARELVLKLSPGAVCAVSVVSMGGIS